MSRRWLSERRRDPYHRKAKKLGYRSRAAFKLIQLDDRFGFFEGAKHVLDLGAAPGGWLQVASRVVGEDGLVVGVDLEEISPLSLGNVRTLVGDATEEETLERIRAAFPGGVDLLLSDMSPHISGVWEVDHLRQIHLARSALRVAEAVLKPGGWAVVKAFQGSEFEAFLKDARRMFEYVKIAKPLASRKGSAEVYIVARGLKRRSSPRSPGIIGRA
ncbi:MAG: RlmE family RNA methyltransferase [Candidatus Bathyarchaeia archaeon]